jgi:hypothetical protein
MGGKKQKKEGAVKNPNAPKQTLKNKKKAIAEAIAFASKKTEGSKQTTILVKEQKSK